MSDYDFTNLTPLTLEGMKAENLAKLRAKIHAAVDAMLDSVEFDADGDAVNVIDVNQATSFVQVPVMADTFVRLTQRRSLNLNIGTTFRKMEEEIAQLKTAEAVRSSAGYTLTGVKMP